MKRLALLLSIAASGALSAEEPRLVAPDRAKQLLLDPRVVQSAENAKLTLGTVEKEPRNPLFRADRPWENALNNLYPNVLWDTDEHRFKLWYKCVLTDKDVIARMENPATIHDQGWFLLHATSRDGLAWEKPAIGQLGFDGSKANNAVARDTPNAGVFRDPHDPNPARRFKMVYDVGLGKLRTRTSPDGITWSEPREPLGFAAFHGDTHNNAFWDERTGKYVWFTKAYLGERLVARFESADFVNWKSSGVVLRSSIEEGRKHQTYCLPVFPYADGYLGFVMMYHPGTDRAVDCELAWSPDSINWTRVAPGTAFIPRGPKGSYDSACIYAPSGPAIAQDDRLLIFYGGDFMPHQGWKRHCLPCLARLRVDGFAGYEPENPTAPAIIVTQPMKVTGPPQITADVRGGSVSVSVLDDPAFGSAPAAPLLADATDGILSWPGRDASQLVGRVLRFRIELRNAKLYAIRGAERVPAPVATTGVRHFTDTLEVGLRAVDAPANAVIRFTTDGSAPLDRSPAWSAPLHLAQTTRLRARAFLPGSTGGGAEFDETFARLQSRRLPLADAARHFAFDEPPPGWRGVDTMEHRATGGAPGGFVTASRAGGLRPFAFLPHDAGDGLAGDWPTKLGGAGAVISFQTRCAGGGGFQLELFAGDVAAWSHAGFAKFSPEWRNAVAEVRWDWNDAEAEAAGWVRGAAAFSWRETIRHVGKVVVVATAGGTAPAFDLDEFRVAPFAD